MAVIPLVEAEAITKIWSNFGVKLNLSALIFIPAVIKLFKHKANNIKYGTWFNVKHGSKIYQQLEKDLCILKILLPGVDMKTVNEAGMRSYIDSFANFHEKDQKRLFESYKVIKSLEANKGKFGTTKSGFDLTKVNFFELSSYREVIENTVKKPNIAMSLFKSFTAMIIMKLPRYSYSVFGAVLTIMGLITATSVAAWPIALATISILSFVGLVGSIIHNIKQTYNQLKEMDTVVKNSINEVNENELGKDKSGYASKRQSLANVAKTFTQGAAAEDIFGVMPAYYATITKSVKNSFKEDNFLTMSKGAQSPVLNAIHSSESFNTVMNGMVSYQAPIGIGLLTTIYSFLYYKLFKCQFNAVERGAREGHEFNNYVHYSGLDKKNADDKFRPDLLCQAIAKNLFIDIFINPLMRFCSMVLGVSKHHAESDVTSAFFPEQAKIAQEYKVIKAKHKELQQDVITEMSKKKPCPETVVSAIDMAKAFGGNVALEYQARKSNLRY